MKAISLLTRWKQSRLRLSSLQRLSRKEQAQETIAFARSKFAEAFGKETAERIYFLYGGSMNEKNAKELLGMPDIDGGLIGGASLVAEKFAKIVEAF